MIGKVYISVVKYYDIVKKCNGLKQRPVLIIGQPDSNDYVALPISRIPRSNNIHSRYDYPLDINSYPSMKLTARSFIRTHKQFITNRADLTKIICDFKKDYPDSYVAVLELVEKFQKELIDSAL